MACFFINLNQIIPPYHNKSTKIFYHFTPLNYGLKYRGLPDISNQIGDLWCYGDEPSTTRRTDYLYPGGPVILLKRKFRQIS